MYKTRPQTSRIPNFEYRFRMYSTFDVTYKGGSTELSINFIQSPLSGLNLL